MKTLVKIGAISIGIACLGLSSAFAARCDETGVSGPLQSYSIQGPNAIVKIVGVAASYYVGADSGIKAGLMMAGESKAAYTLRVYEYCTGTVTNTGCSICSNAIEFIPN